MDSVIITKSNGELEEISIDEFIKMMLRVVKQFGCKLTYEDVNDRVRKILYDGDAWSSDSAHQIILTYLPFTEVGKYKQKH